MSRCHPDGGVQRPTSTLTGLATLPSQGGCTDPTYSQIHLDDRR
jgi:hypothetical protein